MVAARAWPDASVVMFVPSPVIFTTADRRAGWSVGGKHALFFLIAIGGRPGNRLRPLARTLARILL
jgi:hypothetical protein